jgi:DNA-binding NtrC family response regulator
MSNHKILWAAAGVPLTGALWGRLKNLGCELVVKEPGLDPMAGIQELSPRVWVGEMASRDDSDLEWVSRIRSSFPELPLLLMSRFPSVDQAVKAIKIGAADYVPVDVSHEQLSAILEGLLLRDSVKSPAASPPRERPPHPWVHPIAADPAMLRLLAMTNKIAARPTTVLLQGESGTGKEVIARYIHRKSGRSEGPFVAVNCAALPETLLESELFGHEKGAFTGASLRKKGKFELAEGGTLLLDEISEMPLFLQAKLLRVLQEKEVDRIGGQAAVPVDVRVIATTNRNLEEETKAGNFRLDLFYRLNVIPLWIPPLRERKGELLPLSNYFLKKHGQVNGERPKELSFEAVELMESMDWPGNVRELENLMERATLLVESDTIRPEDLVDMGLPVKQGEIERGDGPVSSLKEMEKKMIVRALQGQEGNRTHAARVLGISVRTLRNKLHEYKEELEREGVLTRE